MTRKMAEFAIKIDTMPPNWNEIIDALHKEGTWANPIITPQLEIYYDDPFPIPWDADVRIHGEDIRLIGSAQPGGPPGCGYAETHVRLEDANRYFILAFQVCNDDDGNDNIGRFRAMLNKYEVEFTES